MTTEAAVQGAIVTTWMRDVAEAMKAESGHLTQLDAAIGDGDHGVNMERGFSAVEKALAGQNAEVPPGRLLIVAGKTLVSTVGGASGPLWGVALRRAGRSLGDRESFDGANAGPEGPRLLSRRALDRPSGSRRDLERAHRACARARRCPGRLRCRLC